MFKAILKMVREFMARVQVLDFSPTALIRVKNVLSYLTLCLGGTDKGTL